MTGEPLTGGSPAAVVAVVVAVLLAGLPWWSARAAAVRRTARLATDRRPAGPEHGRAGEPVEVPVVLELLGAALRSGAGVPRALEATGAALDLAAGAPSTGVELRAAADALRLGADWDGAWRHAPDRLRPVHRALRGAWTDGASPSGALRAAGEELLRARRAAARTAAARLAVRLVLPLGACFLPAFVLVGLVPVLLALGIDLLSG
ncbi:type II secretion system F family protein [Isoptericola sp. 4D.3]|jgi:pilus assembly protein TadC|uniref:Type II secretion system F family protein n=1 Tax=Isoptericola peretonis TaxID=2918523 RepID=A0ABT0J0D3_9MICO|nr:type II secretion system F family protein [Isoptericola sp. 4D.3]